MSSILGTIVLNVGDIFPIGILNVYYPVQTLMLTEANIFAILHIER